MATGTASHVGTKAKNPSMASDGWVVGPYVLRDSPTRNHSQVAGAESAAGTALNRVRERLAEAAERHLRQ